MKIAMMVRGYLPAPRPVDMIYAPIDLAVALAVGLGKKGHTVDFYGPLGTQIHAPNVAVRTMHLRPLAHNQQETTQLYRNNALMSHYMPGLWDRYLANEMFERAAKGEYDLLHFHHPEIALPSAETQPQVPVVYTLHDPVYPWYREMFELFDSTNQHYISISKNQRRDAPDLRYLETVHNGINLDEFAYSEEAEDYLLFAGRIVPDKGVKEAVQIAQQTGHRLLIIGPVYPDSQDYFDQYIKPHLSDKILHLGYVEREHMPKYYQKAKALLTPVQWEEPFGLTSIEAMACGTPVISLHRGAAPEIIADGKTGFVVHSITDMCEAVKKIESIKRKDCRAHVQKHFCTDIMVDGYEAAFSKLIQGRKKTPGQLVRSRLLQVPQQLKKGFKAKKDKASNQLNLNI